jgi:hypothetical protein
MKKLLLISLIIAILFFSGCVEIPGRRVVVQGKITDMKYHSVGWSGLDTVYDTTFDNKTIYEIRSTDFKQYNISQGDIVRLELHQIVGGEYYVIYEKQLVTP